MIINLIATGKNMSAWVNTGWQEYQKRLPAEYKLQLTEIAALKRSKSANLNQIKEKEGDALIAAMPKGSLVIALDEHGREWTTHELAQQLEKWRANWPQVSLLIGGPEGLSHNCLQQAQTTWSLSKLTLPHPLVRVVVAEQLYRAWSILAGHPYHRD